MCSSLQRLRARACTHTPTHTHTHTHSFCTIESLHGLDAALSENAWPQALEEDLAQAIASSQQEDARTGTAWAVQACAAMRFILRLCRSEGGQRGVDIQRLQRSYATTVAELQQRLSGLQDGYETLQKEAEIARVAAAAAVAERNDCIALLRNEVGYVPTQLSMDPKP
jgi:hypothetical protein